MTPSGANDHGELQTVAYCSCLVEFNTIDSWEAILENFDGKRLRNDSSRCAEHAID